MLPRLILAPAGYGKTHFVIQRIRQIAASEALARMVVLLPNTLQAAAFRRRLAEAGGALGVEALTFATLYARLLSDAGQPIPRLLDPVQVRLLRAIVDELCARGQMRYYAPLRNRPGFIAALRNTLQELKRARIFPEAFAAAVGADARLVELATVYSAYQKWLQDHHWADPEGQGWLAAIALGETPSLGNEIRLLAVVGFDEFNPTQLGVLAHLAGRAGETLITLSGDTHHPSRPAQRRFQRAHQALEAALPFQVQSLDTASLLSPTLARIESRLFERPAAEDAPPPATLDPSPSIEFIEAQTRAGEVRAALRWLKARLVREGLALNEVALLARDLDAYRPFVEETAAEFGLPVRLVGGLPLAENPAIAALMRLLDLPIERPSSPAWKRRPVLDAWRSPYFDWSAQGIAPAEAAALDAAARQAQVIAGLDQWCEALTLLEQHNAAAGPVDEEFLVAAGRTGVALREKFEAFAARITPPERAPLRTFIAFVEDLIGDDALLPPHGKIAGEEDKSLGMARCARAAPATIARDVAALRAFKDVLRGLALAEATLGIPPLNYTDFYQELRGAVEAATYSADGESGLLVASVLGGRGLSFRAVALLGLAEGEFPRREREDILLRESDRAALREQGLPIELKLRGDEGTLFYQAITRASGKLLLVRPYLAEDGQPWEPSPFWEDAYRLAGRPPVKRIRPEEGIPPEEAASHPEWVETSCSFDAHLERGLEMLRARLGRQAAGIFEGEMPEMAPDLAARFGPAHTWSASRLEAYGTCPFYFYIGYALELAPRTLPEEGYDVRVLGSMLHKILEDLYQRSTRLDECLALLPEIALGVFAAAPQEYGFRPGRLWEQQQQELLRTLHKTVKALDEASQGFAPRHLEAKFGMGNPPLVLPTAAGDIRLHGYIDRVDGDAAGRLRVMDYKSGGAAITLKHLQEGRRLQLPLYALAARQALGFGEVAGGFYWHLQQARPSLLKLEEYDGGVEAACDMAVAHVASHVSHIQGGDFRPHPPAEGCPHYCPAATFCWRYRSS